MELNCQQLMMISCFNVQSGRFGYQSINGAVRDIVAEEKLRSLWRGLSATIVRDAPFSGIYLAIYSHLKTKTFAGSGRHDKDLSARLNFI